MRRSLLLFIVLFIARGSGWCQSTIHFDNKLQVIGDRVEILTDSNSSIDIKGALKASAFKRSTARFPNLLITPYAYWIRFKIINTTTNKNLAVQFAQPMVDEIGFYQLDGDSLLSVNLSGQRHLFNTRLISHQTFIYPVTIDQGQTRTFYIHLKSGKQLVLPIYLGTVEQVLENAMFKDITFGIWIGVIVVMLLYNLFIYFSVRDKNYLYYVGYLLIVLVSQSCLEGYFFRFILPTHYLIADISIYVATALIGVAAIEFSKNFLNAKKFTPVLFRVSYLFWVLYSVQVFLAFIGLYNASYKLMLILAMTSALYVLSMAITIVIKGYRAAKYYLIAWSIFIGCVIVYVLKDFNIVFPYNDLTSSALLIGSATEAILISFALADRINIFKAEKEQSQEETVKALKENERIIQERNTVLETMVKERTVELIGANDELVNTLSDLKQAQLQLVESEKMASLGQLTAGIAHEINNPINFVTSNINPLKRDIEMVIKAFSVIENVGVSDLSVAEKQQQIIACKEDIDFDYVKVEIDHLLKGINEGAKRTADIVKGLKIFSRLDEDDLKLADINEGLASTLVIVNNSLDNIDLRCTYGELPKIYCYPGKLNQVFLNIITNAVYAVKKKFQSAPGAEIRIITKTNGTALQIYITDNGTGMHENTKKKIFEPFFTTKDVGEGTGLGMSIVYNIIKKHDGKILIDSTPGEGSEFLIELPLNIKKADTLHAVTTESY